MHFPSSSEKMGQTLQQMIRHWERKRKEEANLEWAALSPPPAFTITIEREAGVLGTSVAREIGKRLDWPVYDHELLERIAQEMGLHASLLESVDERRVGWLTEAFEALMGVPWVSEGGYVQHLVKTVLALGSHGDCVIVGRGAAFILPTAATLRVRLVAPLEDRVAALSHRLDIPRDEAARQIKTTDKERAAFARDHFRRDVADPNLYDLVLNFASFDVDGSAAVIVDALRHAREKARKASE